MFTHPQIKQSFSTQISYFLLRSKSFQALKIKEQAVSQLRTFHDVSSRQEVNLQSLTCPEEFIQDQGIRFQSSKQPFIPGTVKHTRCSVVLRGGSGHPLVWLGILTLPPGTAPGSPQLRSQTVPRIQTP